jgi:hypothetical protein
MSLIVVSRFMFYDREKGDLVEALDMGTDKAIRELGGVVIPGSSIVVDESRVGRAGLLIRSPQPGS